VVRAILIDDEPHCLETLGMLLERYCPSVQVVQQCDTARQGLEATLRHQADLVFLDVEMPMMNGFELLEKLGPLSFSVIFTSGYDKYAIKAIRFSAIDYLLKPVDPQELVKAVHKVEMQRRPPTAEQFQILLDRLRNNDKGFTKIAVPTSEGFELVPVNDVIACEADDNYTNIHLKNKRKIIACRTLKEIEEQLESFPYFVRVHHSHMANLNEVAKYIKGDGGYLVMSDGTTVNVSRSRKEALIKFF
jgi:two-component system LytT family response regulator